MEQGRLGVITEGSFTGGLTVRLDSPDVEELQVGSFVVLEGDRQLYFSLIHDLQLRVTDQGVVADPPANSPFIRNALHGVHTYAAATVRPSLEISQSDRESIDGAVRAVRTIPGHFSVLRRAQKTDFDTVFGAETDEQFALGSPIANDEIMIPINLPKLVERSNGIFGQTGTGKSVLARLILYGLIRSKLASTLIFDMHDEYATGDPNRPEIPGLRTFFGTSRIKVYSLDKRSGGSDPHITIGLNQIRPDDIALLAGELDLRDTFDASAYALSRAFGDEWLSQLLTLEGDDLAQFCDTYSAHPAAIEGLRRKLRYLESSDYIVSHQASDPVQEILGHLENQHHVVIQFGRHSRLRDYMLVANLLTRRIHDRYTDRAQRAAPGARTLPPLLVVLEEAHKFLSPEAARQSIFGTIAREMRKFGVSLLVVDQRPSGIESEILSQLGTRVTGLLTDPADIEAVLSGTGDRSAMRAMLASLEPSRQCLVVGHAIP
ncbi:MAG: ATP-binding protein, partial [Chloroflexota bacterium]